MIGILTFSNFEKEAAQEWEKMMNNVGQQMYNHYLSQ